MTIIVDSLALNYTDEGKGRTVLMLHGWGDSLKTFDDLTKDIVSAGYRVVRLDLPGFGKSEAPHVTFNLGSYAELVGKFIAKLNIDKPYLVIGHSNGGAIAMKGLSANYFSADKLVLLASSGVRADFNGSKKILRLAAKAGKVPVALLPKSVQRSVKRKAYQAIGSDLFVAEHLQDTFKAVVSEDLLDQARNISIPTLLIYGSRDEATPVRYGELFQKAISQAELVVIEGAGHFVHHDYAARVTQLTEEFMVK